MKQLAATLVWSLLSAATLAVQAADPFRVFGKQLPNGVEPALMMDAWLKQLAFAALDRRDAEYEKLKTPEQLAAYQQRLKRFFLDTIGPFPERTPLNARVTGKQSFADYRIEKIIFESQPGFFVTGTLYLPLGAGPHPAVLHPTGHSVNAKAAELYQRASILLAKNGLACLCYDPVGQGERHHFFKTDGSLQFTSTTQEHQLMGQGTTLLGMCLARYFIWDGMRAIDYLQSRADIDPKRLGCTGISGGGTQTSYFGALDERLVATAPGCYLTGFRRLLETIGPQDIEQNIFGQIAAGLDHGDYVMLRAPKPTLVMAATRDFFDISGAWSLHRQAKRFYTRLGFAEREDLIEADTQHGFPTEMRVAATRWMRRWLLGKDDAVTEPDFPVLKDAELASTPEGHVLRLPGARSLFDLNVEINQQLAAERKRLWQQPTKALEEVRRITGIRRTSELPIVKAVKVSAEEAKDVRLEKFTLEPEPGIWLPALMWSPKNPDNDAYLYLHGEGKHVDTPIDGPIQKLADAGHSVLAVDLRGIGETAHSPQRAEPIMGSNGKEYSTAYLLGKSFVAMRAEDTLACARWLANSQPGRKLRVHLVAIGELGVPALHATALEPELFASVKLDRTLTSWSDVVATPLTKNQQINLVHGALKAYDLPDLIASLPKEKLTVVNPLKANSEPTTRGSP